MRINQRLKDFLLGLLGIGLFIFFLIFVLPSIFVYSFEAISFVIEKGNENNFPWAISFLVLFIIASLINTIYEDLKSKNLKFNRKNIIAEIPTQLFALVIGILLICLGIYLINLWYGFIFVFLIGGFLYTFTKSFRGK